MRYNRSTAGFPCLLHGAETAISDATRSRRISYTRVLVSCRQYRDTSNIYPILRKSFRRQEATLFLADLLVLLARLAEFADPAHERDDFL